MVCATLTALTHEMMMPSAVLMYQSQLAIATERPVTRATGTFDVKLTPQDDKLDATLGRMIIDKRFEGELQGTSIGQMLTAGSAEKGSAGYVAVERVSGTLAGRSGSFTLQHAATMTRGHGELTITVVPDSGTDALAGISGRLAITIADGKHYYDFEYALRERK